MSGLRLATRRSPLALRQAEFVRERLRAVGIESSLVPVETVGDRALDVPLVELGGRGVFAVEVQQALLRGEADVAVHSAKDLPSTTPEGLVLASVPERLDGADVLVGRSLAGLGPGATVATGSPRRRALLLERRPDLRVVELRGNMARRLEIAASSGVDAVITAAAALARLEESARVAQRLDPQWFIPQVGQGALALEVRSDDEQAFHAVASINLDDAMMALIAERSFLKELGAGCSIPAGAHANVVSGRCELRGVMIAVDGSSSVRHVVSGTDPMLLGIELARNVRDEQGGAQLPGWS
jgi:hydroxymethylbilane synthase